MSYDTSMSTSARPLVHVRLSYSPGGFTYDYSRRQACQTRSYPSTGKGSKITKQIALMVCLRYSNPMNTLYYDDNLEILRDYIKDESVETLMTPVFL